MILFVVFDSDVFFLLNILIKEEMFVKVFIVVSKRSVGVELLRF